MVFTDGLRLEVNMPPESLKLKASDLVALSASGTRAEKMIEVFPSGTYPSHTSLVTGTNSAVHDIVNNRKLKVFEIGGWVHGKSRCKHFGS